MKKIFKHMLVVLMATATLGFAACGDDDKETTTGGNTNGPAFESLVNTEWEGTFSTVADSPMGVVPVTLTWVLDYAADGRLDVMFTFESQATQATPFYWEGTYTYDPSTFTGTMHGEDFEADTFTLDPYNRTIRAGLGMYAEHEAGGEPTYYGGMVTLHQVR